MKTINPMLLCDFYKTDHRRQYPAGTEFVYSNLTARYNRVPGMDRVVVFGIQAFCQEYLVNRFNEGFFHRPKADVLREFDRRMHTSLGPNEIGVDHVAALHDLGYLPLHLKALPEGSLCPVRVPMLTLVNTKPEFYWLTNFLETLLSNALWHPMTAATIAHQYRKLLDAYAARTSDMPGFVDWQGHDFSMRGHSSLESSILSGAGHLLSFTGTDTIPAIDFLEQFYGANADSELIGGSVPATEHSVMCMGGKETEEETYRRLLSQVYPKGIVSIVSDTWDYWKVLTETLPALKALIMGRDGKLVVRPDSGDPVKILCGDEEFDEGPERQGTIEVLWDTFGGTVNSKGFKQLDPHVGCIYGDSITLERAQAICAGLEAKGFASTNVVFGIGSYTYQFVTRDTLGFAMKATWGQINGKPAELFKSPKTDVGVKHSAKGLLCVDDNLAGGMLLTECCTPEQEASGLLRTVFRDGRLENQETLAEIRRRLKGAH